MFDNPIHFQYLQERTNFFFLRHGESEGNKRRMFQGHVDMPLTDTGRMHAESAGAYLSQLQPEIDGIFTSPLVRARETAEIVARSCHIPEDGLMLRESLMELDTGIFSGLTVDEIQQRYPDQWNKFQHRSWAAVPTAETLDQLLGRAYVTWQELISYANQGHKSVLSVSHGGMINWLYKITFSDRWNDWLPNIHTGNCGIYQFTVTPVPNDQGSEGPGYFCQWRLMNHIPY